MESLWTFIGLIVLVSIIAGISLHDAFIGAITFFGGVVLFVIAGTLLLGGFAKFLAWFNKPRIKEAKVAPAKPRKTAAQIAQEKRALKSFWTFVIGSVVIAALILLVEMLILGRL